MTRAKGPMRNRNMRWSDIEVQRFGGATELGAMLRKLGYREE
jgi:hypothetical protein